MVQNHIIITQKTKVTSDDGRLKPDDPKAKGFLVIPGVFATNEGVYKNYQDWIIDRHPSQLDWHFLELLTNPTEILPLFGLTPSIEYNYLEVLLVPVNK